MWNDVRRYAQCGMAASPASSGAVGFVEIAAARAHGAAAPHHRTEVVAAGLGSRRAVEEGADATVRPDLAVDGRQSFRSRVQSISLSLILHTIIYTKRRLNDSTTRGGWPDRVGEHRRRHRRALGHGEGGQA